MTDRISSEGRKHYDAIYDSLKGNFPKTCGTCRTVYRNEADYNFRTTEKPGCTNSMNFGMGFLFYRDCKCKSTLGLDIDPKKFRPQDWAEFLAYLNRRAHRDFKRKAEEFEAKGRNLVEIAKKHLLEKCFDSVLQEVRREYNSYLHEHLENGQ